jgi:hypothetical protein
MTYATAHIENLFSQMRHLAPALSVVRTDYSPARDGFGDLREVTFDKAPRRDTIRLTKSPTGRAGAIARIATFFGLAADQALQLYELAEQLHATNPVGSWCLAPSALPQALRLGLDKPNAHTYIDDVVADVSEVLPAIQSIQVVSSMQPLPQGHTRRRVFLRFRAEGRKEAAALDTAHFAAHLDSLLVGANSHSDRNNQRAQAWADQLGIAFEDLPSLLHDLSLLCVSLPSTEIQLRTATPSVQATALARAAG